ncbi:ABC transporter substrate-binding protein [Pseudaestuariivita sp.]|uniref:ABC transporter substrate-binding protein n=1 Tax=Pseudaestuariivita sp. TaxID=2211669 RepID=UPI0040587F6D
MRLALAVVLAPLAVPLTALAQERPDIVVAVSGIFRTMEPIVGNSTNAARIMPNIFDQVVARNFTEDPEGSELRPALATDWEQVDDLTWRFTIREGVTFHNGDTMTAEDVAFSMSAERIWGEDSLVPAGKRYTTSFVSVEALDDTTVEIKTSVNDPNLPYRFITPLGYVVPKDHYLEVGPEAFGQNPVGTGPYRVTGYDATGFIKLEAFDDYWGGTPPLASVEYRAVPEFSARLAGMVSGEFMMMAGIPVDEVETVESYDDLTYISRPIGNYIMLAYNTLELPEYGPNPVADVNLRYAMTAAIDREGLVAALWGEDTFAPAPFNFPDFPDYYDASIEPKITYDPEAAKAYLEASDYNGEEIVVNVTRGAFSNFDLATEFLAEQWNAMGINVRLNVVDSWSVALQHPFNLLNMSMTTTFDGTPTRAIWGFWGPDSARASREKDKSWSPPAEFVSLGEQYLAETDTEAKVALFRQMVDVWETEQPALILWRNVNNWVVNDALEWTSTNSNWMLLGPDYLTVR